ncbi:MAG: Uma2 family endonuclease [Phaeodactylibacter sp.]|nr:Uma2 family endonuclease [Phaeodactylibacter sp.]
MSNTVALEKKLLTCDDYHAMIAAGILDEDDKVELIHGELIYMSPLGPNHGGATNRLNNLLQELLKGSAIIAVQNPVTLTPFSEPEPDVAVLKPRKDFYSGSHPVPEEIFLLIEVADTTLEKDRTVKASLYAAGGIPFYWIVNLPEMQLEVYSQPAKDQYKLRRIYLPDEKVEIPSFGIMVEVVKLIGEAQ